MNGKVVIYGLALLALYSAMKKKQAAPQVGSQLLGVLSGTGATAAPFYDPSSVAGYSELPPDFSDPRYGVTVSPEAI